MYQAVLYSHDSLVRWDKHFTDVYFRHAKKGEPLLPKDVYVADFIKEQRKKDGKRFKALVFTPNLFQHIGIHSAIGNKRTIASAQISYTFPDDDEPIVFDESFIKGK